MQETMRCLQIEKWGGDLHQEERPIPKPGAGEVVVEVEATSVGLTVGNVMNGDLGNDNDHLPRIPGHEVIGRIRESGPGVSHLDPRDRVGAYFYLSCNHCNPCRRGYDSLCENLGGFVSVDTDGGFAEYIQLPADNALTLLDGLSPIDATVVPDAVATSYHVANQRANVEHGDDVLILGAGDGVGIHLMRIIQYFSGHITAVDCVAEKLERCGELGAERTVNTSKQSLIGRLENECSFDAVVDFTGKMDLVTNAKNC